MILEIAKSTDYPKQFNLDALAQGTPSAEGVWMEDSEEWNAAAQLVSDLLNG